jgi:hypothetical protein
MLNKIMPINFKYAPRLYGKTMEMQNTMQEWSNMVSKEYAKKSDGILIEAINNAIGTGWTIETIKHRLAIHSHINKPGQEIILLDNCPILELLPVENFLDQNARATLYKIERQYRFLPYKSE